MGPLALKRGPYMAEVPVLCILQGMPGNLSSQGAGLWGPEGNTGWWDSWGAGLWRPGEIPEPLSLQTIGAGSC